MSEPSKEAIERACELLSCSTTQTHLHPVTPVAHFIQEVSDVAEKVASYLATGGRAFDLLSALILPDPEPDVVEEVWHLANKSKDHFRSELAKRGYVIRKGGPHD